MSEMADKSTDYIISMSRKDWAATIQELNDLSDLLYRLVVKKDGTARIEAEALLKGEGK